MQQIAALRASVVKQSASPCKKCIEGGEGVQWMHLRVSVHIPHVYIVMVKCHMQFLNISSYVLQMSATLGVGIENTNPEVFEFVTIQ